MHAKRNTGKPVTEPKGSKKLDKDVHKNVKGSSFRAATGAHKECGHLS